MRPIPLRPDPFALEAADRRLILRGLTAIAVAAARGEDSDRVCRSLFPRDDEVVRFARSLVDPTMAADFPQATALGLSLSYGAKITSSARPLSRVSLPTEPPQGEILARSGRQCVMLVHRPPDELIE